MAVKSWVAKHTGLPSFYSPTPARVVAPDGRVLADGTLPVMVSDALAAPDVEGAYRVGEQTVRLARADRGHAFTLLDGRSATPVSVTGDDQRQVEPGQGDSGVRRWRIGPVPVSGSVECRTRGAATGRLRQITASHTRLVLLHSPAECQIPECDIEPVRVLRVDSAREARTGRVDVAERDWQINYTLDNGRHVGAAPVLTWGEWAGFDGGVWRSRTTEALLRLIAGMP